MLVPRVCRSVCVLVFFGVVAACSERDRGADAAASGGAALDALAPPDAVAEGDAPTAPPEDGGSALTYARDIHPMFLAAGCASASCHGSVFTTGGLLFLISSPRNTWLDLVNRTSIRSDQVLVSPGAPDQSVLVTHAESTLLSMAILDAPRAALVRRWVLEGAALGEVPAGDGGTPADAGGGDAAAADDAGDGGAAACTIEGLTGFPALPDACLPRCSSATWAAIDACRTSADPAGCQAAATAGDTTPSVEVAGSALAPITCEDCLNWQNTSCLFDVCPVETLAWTRCNGAPTFMECSDEELALQRCAVRAPAYATCVRARQPRCGAAP